MKNENYRFDIDALRAISVISVLFFHCGVLPNGYLGVDVFFVISGFLISDIIYSETLGKTFTISNFYLRRLRRIIPLVLITCLVTFIFGFFILLPDDFENLTQSIIATNLFSNNILLYLTTRDYWNIANEYKPLMHTWSLGIEEQFYFIYPLLFLALRNHIKLLKYSVILITLVSLAAFVLNQDSSSNFFLLPFRFFELSIGGIGAIFLKNRLSIGPYIKEAAFLFILIILSGSIRMENKINVFLITLSSCLFLLSAKETNLFSWFIRNPFINTIGLTSFSIYMWHQPILAFTRSKFDFEGSLFVIFSIIFMTLIVAYASYRLIEQPFRDKTNISNKFLFVFCGTLTFILIVSSYVIYSKSGVVRDVPELEIYSKNEVVKNLHSKYNDRIYSMNQDFKDSTKIHILLLGNSFARDWGNILLESNLKNQIEISYEQIYETKPSIYSLISKADRVYFSDSLSQRYKTLLIQQGLDLQNIYILGEKYFGKNMGIHYSPFNKDHHYYGQKTHIPEKIIARNNIIKSQYKDHFVDFLEVSMNDSNEVSIFTPDKKFISQDTRHLTKAGAIYYSILFKSHIDHIKK